MQETDPRAPSVPDPVVRISHWYGVVIGLVSAAVAVSSAVFIASLANTSSPINTVGNSFIDRAPSWLKEFSTAAFETNSKTVLQSGIWIVLVVVAVVLGYRSTTSIAPLVGGIVFFAIIGYASAIDQPNNNLITALAPFIGATLGILSAIYLASLFRVRTRSINTPSESQVPLGWDRRRFVQSAALLGVAAAAVGVVGRRNEVARINSARAQIPKTLPPVVADETATFIETGFHPD
jgi:sulfite oxidase